MTGKRGLPPGQCQECQQQECSRSDGGAPSCPRADSPFSLGRVSPLEDCEPSLTSKLLLSLQLFAMVFAMCLFRGIQ